MMEAPAEPCHFVENYQQRSKCTGSSVYQSAREKFTKHKDPSKRLYESHDYPYPSHQRRATTLPGLDQRITELDNADTDTYEDIIMQVRVENQREAALPSGGGTRERAGNTEILPLDSRLKNHARNDVTHDGAMHLQSGLRYAMSGALSPEDERGSPEVEVILQFEDEENVYDAYPVTTDISSHRSNDNRKNFQSVELIKHASSGLALNMAAESASSEEACGNQQSQRGHSWDSSPRPPFFNPTLLVPLSTPTFFKFNHQLSCFNPLSQIQAHIRNIQGLDLIVQAVIYGPKIHTPALLNQNVLTMDSARLQAEYTYLASEVAMNRDMQQEDISVLAAGPLYPQHVRVHASHELRQLQTQEHAMLKTMEDIKTEMKAANEWSAKVQNIEKENLQQSRAQLGPDSKKIAGVTKARFEELDLEELSLEDDEYLEVGGPSNGKGRRWRRSSDVVFGTCHELNNYDDVEEISRAAKAPSRESNRGRFKF